MSCKNAVKQRQENRNTVVQSPVLAVSTAVTKNRAKEKYF